MTYLVVYLTTSAMTPYVRFALTFTIFHMENSHYCYIFIYKMIVTFHGQKVNLKILTGSTPIFILAKSSRKIKLQSEACFLLLVTQGYQQVWETIDNKEPERKLLLRHS